MSDSGQVKQSITPSSEISLAPAKGIQMGTGVVLSRSLVGEGSLRMTLFLKGQGMIWANAPGAEMGRVRFGGGTEPLVWAKFKLRHGQRGQGIYIESIDIEDDMLKLRRRRDTLLMAARWSKLILKHLPPEQPSDDLLANFYWNLKLLADSSAKILELTSLCEGANWRFLWRWLGLWGLAPDLSCCSCCGNEIKQAAEFHPENGLLCEKCSAKIKAQSHLILPFFKLDELVFLDNIARLDIKSATQTLINPTGQLDMSNLFKRASRCAEQLLHSLH